MRSALLSLVKNTSIFFVAFFLAFAQPVSAIVEYDVLLNSQLEYNDFDDYLFADYAEYTWSPITDGCIVEIGGLMSASNDVGTVFFSQFVIHGVDGYPGGAGTTWSVDSGGVTSTSNITIENGNTVPVQIKEAFDPSIVPDVCVEAGNEYRISMAIGRTGGWNGDVRYYGSNSAASSVTWSASSTVITPDKTFYYIGANTSWTDANIIFASTPTSTCDFNSFATVPYFSDGEWYDEYSNGSVWVTYGIQSEVYRTGTVVTDANRGLNFTPKPNTAPPSTGYVATAWLCTAETEAECWNDNGTPSSTIITNSAQWSFDVVQCSETVLYPGSNTPYNPITEGEALSCDGDLGSFEKVICEAFSYWFIPSAESTAIFSRLRAKVENKPPFGYFTVYSNAINGFENATSTTSSVQTVDSSFASDLDEWATLDIIQTIRGIITWLFWIVFVFYMYHRFKNFSLHG